MRSGSVRNSPVNIKVRGEGRGRCAPSSWAEIPLQPVERWCKAGISLMPWWMCPEGGCSPWRGAQAGAGLSQKTARSLREGSTLEQGRSVRRKEKRREAIMDPPQSLISSSPALLGVGMKEKSWAWEEGDSGEKVFFNLSPFLSIQSYL